MTENQIGFLIKAAAFISKGNDSKSLNILKSYYLMRCKEITRGYGLPQKHFSVISRCPNCCIEWRDNTEIRVKPIKLSKNQRRIRLRQKKSNKVRNNEILSENKLERICGFCKHVTSTSVLKPRKQNLKSLVTENNNTTTQLKIKKKAQIIPNTGTSVYCQSKEAFSLININNTLASKVVKEKPKIINCKKKKDKFAGLCQRAVLAANKLKLEKDEQNTTNKIKLFLKPSLK